MHNSARLHACWLESSRALSAQLARGDQPATFFVPQHEPDTAETLDEGKAADYVELGMITQHPLQTVKRNSTTEVVHVVDADISGEPTQNARQFIMRAAILVLPREGSTPAHWPNTCSRIDVEHRIARRQSMPPEA